MRKILISLCLGSIFLLASCNKIPDSSKEINEDTINKAITITPVNSNETNKSNNSDSQMDDKGQNDEKNLPITIQTITPVITGSTLISNEKFSINIPDGWEVETTGEYETFGLRAYDPSNPARQIFYYGKMDPFLKSQDAKDFYANSIQIGGSGYQFYADAPVLDPATTENFYYKFNDFAEYAYQYGIIHDFPSFNDLEFVESYERNSLFSNYATDEKILRGFFTQDGIYCEGQIAASIYDAISYNANGIDTGFYYVYMIAGVTAPVDEFLMVQEQLVEAISSFEYTQAYIDEGVSTNQVETEQIINMGKVIRESYDSYNEAWENRQLTYDALSQKQSDATLGYTRVVDTATGETYKAYNDFYEQYQSNPNVYTNPNLVAIEDDDYENYSKSVSGYITN